jgi:hypothetical protein
MPPPIIKKLIYSKKKIIFLKCLLMSTDLNNVYKSIDCPAQSKTDSVKNTIDFWIPSFEKYAFGYTGLRKQNKKDKRKTLGENYFVKLKGKKCDNNSLDNCGQKDQYVYMKEFPIGRIPKCIIKPNGEFKTELGPKIIGSTGIIGGLQEDVLNLNGSDFMKSLVGLGPYASRKCMKVTLPAGNFLLNSGMKKSKEMALRDKKGWWEETRCVSHEPTVKKKYANKIYNIPFSISNCEIETFASRDTARPPKAHSFLFRTLVVLFAIMFGIILYKLLSR